jgi:hypothetical protein
MELVEEAPEKAESIPEKKLKLKSSLKLSLKSNPLLSKSSLKLKLKMK